MKLERELPILAVLVVIVLARPVLRQRRAGQPRREPNHGRRLGAAFSRVAALLAPGAAARASPRQLIDGEA